ncbi:hypothetical protein J7E97_22410 [Streptomyces sp. ISL-66]|uniref:ATP-binding protein n=1 Tax=Streptomyces sp. ISL-66 TaxID=2819186 RepID=UPI001BEB0189|nr:ATP-binding protein [Streptomyces sp. ISL-66]MBT2470546.1 hypothetical protein [Streptomyces sp. ISL-66]
MRSRARRLVRERVDAFGDAAVAATMLERLLHPAVVVGIDGLSHRLRGRQQQARVLQQGANARVS